MVMARIQLNSTTVQLIVELSDKTHVVLFFTMAWPHVIACHRGLGVQEKQVKITLQLTNILQKNLYLLNFIVTFQALMPNHTIDNIFNF